MADQTQHLGSKSQVIGLGGSRLNPLYRPERGVGPQSDSEIVINERNALIAIASDLRAVLRKRGDPQIKPNVTGLLESLGTFSRGLARLEKMVDGLNGTPLSGAGRDSELSKLLLPWAIQGLQRSVTSQEGQDLLDLYLRTHRNLQTRQPEISYPDEMKGVPGFVSICTDESNLPTPGTYLEKSEALQRTYMGIRTRLEATNEKIRELEDLESKAKQPTYKDGIARHKGIKAGLEGEVRGLFEQLSDVFPEDIDQVLFGLGVRATASPAVVNLLVKFTQEIEDTLVFAICTSPSNGVTREGVLQIPQFSASGTVPADGFTFKAAHAPMLRANEDVLANLVDVMTDVRQMLRKVSGDASLFEEVAVAQSNIFGVLDHPFADKGEEGTKTLQYLLEHKSPKIRAAVINLLNDPLGAPSAEEGPEYILSQTITLSPLAWAVKNYLFSQSSGEGEPYLSLMNNVPELSLDLVPLVERVKTAYDEGDVGTVAREIVAQIDQSARTREIFKSLAPIIVLSELVSDEKFATRLKSQISNLDLLTKIPERVECERSLMVEAQERASRIEKALTVSFRDYHRDASMDDLWSFIQEYKLLLENPTLLEGVAGDEGMRSGIIVAGEPGTGKTFFVYCLKTELGLPLLKITPNPGEGEVGNAEEDNNGLGDWGKDEKLTQLAHEKVAEAIRYSKEGKGCILFIDEAEAVLRDRSDPKITPAQEERTCYLLQAISELRRNHPLVLIVAATNYPESIDQAMLRPGRFDISIIMREPGPAMRETIIKQTLLEAKLDVSLSNQQLEELVAITDGLMPLALKRPLIQYSRFGPLQASALRLPFAPSFEEIRELFTTERKRAQTSLAGALSGAKSERRDRLEKK